MSKLQLIHRGKEPLKPQIKDIIVLADFTDGKVRQILCNEQTRKVILNVIALAEQSIKVVDKPVEGIQFTYKEKK